MALPLKAAAKGRDGGEAGAGQVDVGFKADGFCPATRYPERQLPARLIRSAALLMEITDASLTASAAGAAIGSSRTAVRKRQKSLWSFIFICLYLPGLIGPCLQHPGDFAVNDAVDRGVHHAGNPAADAPVDVDRALGAPADLRDLDVESGSFHDLIARIRICGRMNITRNMEIRVPRHRHSPIPTMAGSVVMRAMRNPAADRMLPEVSTVGKERFSAWMMASRFVMEPFSSLYQEEITMA